MVRQCLEGGLQCEAEAISALAASASLSADAITSLINVLAGGHDGGSDCGGRVVTRPRDDLWYACFSLLK